MSCARPSLYVAWVCVGFVCNEHALLIWMSAVRREMSMCLLVWNKSLHSLYVYDFVTGLCVCSEREREEEREGGWRGGGDVCSLGWNGSLPFMNIQLPPAFHWCQLACGKISCPGNSPPQKRRSYLDQKTHQSVESSPKRGGPEAVIKHSWGKSSQSHVAHLKLGQHLGHMFRSVSHHWGIL